jgi:hypothetical protein
VLGKEIEMDMISIWVSDWGNIDITQFGNLKFRKDGGFDRRRKESYYGAVKEYIKRREGELANACESAWDGAKVDMPNIESNRLADTSPKDGEKA